jgi:hypothetical protein
MVFASPIFLFLFLPLTLAAYFAFPRGWRNGVLLVASLAFYAWGEAPYLALVLGSVAFNFAVGATIGKSGGVARTRWLALGIVGNLTTLAIFKYANFAVGNVNALAPILAITPIALAAIPLPSATCRASRSTSCCSRSSSQDRSSAGATSRRSCRNARSASPTSPTACAGSCSASARRC